jgi:Crinkler effector protein N-terminal domain
MTPAATHPSSFLKLICYVKGEPYKNAFEVKIGNEESVAALKECIKEKTSQTFREVDAKSLVLWNVSIPHNPTLTDSVDALQLLDDDELPQVPDEHIQSLSPVCKLSEIFSSPPVEGHVHIVVKPPPARLTTEEANLGEKDDIITAIKTSEFLILDRISAAS